MCGAITEVYLHEVDGPNPGGWCRCGCGSRTALAPTDDSRAKSVRGTPRRYVANHFHRPPAKSAPPNPSGLCMCGCGAKTSLATHSVARNGWVLGEHKRFILGHHSRVKSPDYYLVNENGCWIWQRSLGEKGYGVVRVDGRLVGAHKAYWERENGPVPDGLELDHLCRVRKCVNPAHLEPVTHRENVRRGYAARRVA